MKLLTHNMLACHVRSHKHEEAQPFLIEVTEQGEADADFDPAFLERMFDRIVWKTLYDGALAMGIKDLPESPTKALLDDEVFLRAFHHALLEVSLEEGFLICPFADPSKPNEKRKFAVTKGVPNLLLDEHEC
mmetsp:Transcript_5396/g.15458  ORF Transcript_5396/g.15458 Transcript_5396/m.15458 type:complete len:132 (+) Transcript_5396:262-657(+)|eukprot:CAMPEP_0206143914 /NCGR_PEP_ID=MMETSP1473-20131121/22343_1 /ASSEMBLY_ACC=CAM_ASM_001109 /TAXON_ID=1461547 /ORGANISM="Stichococcus sp, Strain RCC1054" /LENGTH=131 /DNA_ID=CAMNT_0053539541 /DNA_START=257 /DNA_END=652 /DNA_ORIENTATION=+